MSFWKSSDPDTDVWHGRARLGRVQVSLRVYRHRHIGSDRWVFQPGLVYDRKERR